MTALRDVLVDVVQALRAAGVRLSVAEAMDALRAAAAVGVEREPLREALAAATVKDELDRPTFDEVFDRFFSAGEAEARKRRRGAGGAAPGGAAAGRGEGERGHGRPRTDDEKRERPGSRPSPERREERRPEPAPDRRSAELRKRSRRRELLRRPFRDMEPDEAEELAALAEEIARRFRSRLSRRRRRARRGRLDFRRTIRRSVAHGGVPFSLELRRRRPAKPDLLALCDVSGSVRHATDFFAAVLAPCADFFRRVRILVFVDRPFEAAVEGGRLAIDGPIDFHAFSDFGRAFVEADERLGPTIGRSTVVVVLGDARTNRRPPRADALARLRSRARALWWLNPERRSRWGTGDSAIAAYARHCDEVLECANGEELLAALARLERSAA